MAGLKAWDGSAFVDGQPRIWNGTTFVAPSACHIWDGTGFVKVWPTFVRQRMIKNGNSPNAGTSRQRLAGWTSDPTAPATISDDRIVVAGSYGAVVRAQLTPADAAAGTLTAYLVVDGVDVATQSWGGGDDTPKTFSGTANLTDGSHVWVEYVRSGFVRAVSGSGTWVEVAPD